MRVGRIVGSWRTAALSNTTTMFRVIGVLLVKLLKAITARRAMNRARRQALTIVDRQLTRVCVDAKLSTIGALTDRDLARLLLSSIDRIVPDSSTSSKRKKTSIALIILGAITLLVACTPCQRWSYRIGRRFLINVTLIKFNTLPP